MEEKENKIMAEFCKECFLNLNPELSENDLVMIKETELCEGCGKIVNETVLEIKESGMRKLKKSNRKNCE